MIEIVTYFVFTCKTIDVVACVLMCYCCSQDILDITKGSLYNNLKRSLSRYMEMSRPEWLMHKNPKSGENPFALKSAAPAYFGNACCQI